jgi:hypothetical protein
MGLRIGHKVGRDASIYIPTAAELSESADMATYWLGHSPTWIPSCAQSGEMREGALSYSQRTH